MLSGHKCNAQATFEIINKTVSVGVVNYDSIKVSGISYYTNTGDAPLYLTSAVTICPCTTVEISEEALAPGDTGKILITHVFRDIGFFKHSVRIFYFNPEDEAAFKTITITGTAVKKEEDE